MEENKNEKKKEGSGINKNKKKMREEKLPYCTTAPSAEQARANDQDEPCDDGRTGDVD